MNKPTKILICDDDPGVLEVLKIMLEENGYTVFTLSSGKAIEKKILSILPDMIFLDLWMPGIEGQEITKLLKRNQKSKHIPIIIFSALNEGEKIAQEIGADSFLPKPFSYEDLLKKVQEYL